MASCDLTLTVDRTCMASILILWYGWNYESTLAECGPVLFLSPVGQRCKNAVFTLKPAEMCLVVNFRMPGCLFCRDLLAREIAGG